MPTEATKVVGALENRTRSKETIWSRSFVKILTVNFIISMGQFMMNTLVPKFTLSLGATETIVGVVSSVFAFAALLIRPVAGPAMDYFRKSRLLSAALALVILAFLGVRLCRQCRSDHGRPNTPGHRHRRCGAAGGCHRQQHPAGRQDYVRDQHLHARLGHRDGHRADRRPEAVGARRVSSHVSSRGGASDRLPDPLPAAQDRASCSDAALPNLPEKHYCSRGYPADTGYFFS